MQDTSFKIQKTKGSKLKQYGELVVGSANFWVILKFELITLLFSWIPGAFGLGLRSFFYPFLFKKVGKGVVFGKSLTLRHPHKIELGDSVVIDDDCLLDAKGSLNQGIVIENGAFIGRQSSIYGKNGYIRLGKNVNLGIGCILFSSNSITIGEGTLLAAHCYLLSGGNYQYGNTARPFIEQSGDLTQGPLEIGKNCWLGAKVVVLDHASIGDHCVIGAGAVVNQPIAEHSLAVGVPARVIKEI
ncbi:MAG: acyltransferase [Chlamydiota bacterium]|nr:acyltransferase [Chlamydiota bacterium]